MKPRIFVSSTYYDLKYLRERIELFLERFNFEPVLFESDKLTYEHGKPIDTAAYNEVALCQMMILIVGGRYGTPSNSIDNIKEWQKKYDDEFVSITRKEYESAIKQNMPVFIFVDKNVYAEYQGFKENEKFFTDLIKSGKIENGDYKFSHVDDHNVFYFIDSIKQKPIKTFEKVDEIENYLNNQFSGMFFLHLKRLQEEAADKKVLDSVSELNNIVKRMNEMVSGIGKNLLEPQDFQNVVSKQHNILIGFIVEKILSYINFKQGSFNDFKYDTKETYEMTVFLANLIYDNVMVRPNLPEFKRIDIHKDWEDIHKAEGILVQILNEKIATIYPKISIESLSYWEILWAVEKRIEPVFNIKDNKKDIILALTKEIDSNVTPF